MSQSKQAKREQFRVGAAEMGASADGASTLGGGGGGPVACSPGKFLDLASPKRTFRAFSERINKKMDEKLR